MHQESGRDWAEEVLSRRDGRLMTVLLWRAPAKLEDLVVQFQALATRPDFNSRPRNTATEYPRELRKQTFAGLVNQAVLMRSTQHGLEPHPLLR